MLGNLISNTFIVIASLDALGRGGAWLSLAFLVVIHKLEYFLNAKIIGSHIKARAWELLVAILVMEATFGLAGVDRRADLLRVPQGRAHRARGSSRDVVEPPPCAPRSAR